jgi:hypothetical protein
MAEELLHQRAEEVQDRAEEAGAGAADVGLDLQPVAHRHHRPGLDGHRLAGIQVDRRHRVGWRELDVLPHVASDFVEDGF